MFRRISAMTGLFTLAVLGCMLLARPAAAQNQGYSVWAHRYDGGKDRRSEGFLVPTSPAYYAYPPASTPSAPLTRTQAFYYAPGEASPVNATALINVTVPADAKIWFDGSPTVQTGEHRQFVSPPLHHGSTYVYRVQVRWMEAGRPIEETRQVSVAPGGQIELNFTTPSAKEHRTNYYDPDASAPAVTANGRPTSFQSISPRTLPSGPRVLPFSQMGNNNFSREAR
jgi:uncharacterized protein (TIGR03000 family)